MKHNQFKGTGVAMVTPMTSAKEVDASGLVKLTHHLIDGGINFLVVMGTTGESATLTKDERALAIRTVLDVNQGKLPIVLGIGGNNTQAVVNQLKEDDLGGIDAILSVSPYYNKPTQEGIYQHYRTVAEATDLPIILYNVPSRTGSNILPSTTLRLANDVENIVGIKEASPDITQSMELIKNKPDDFLIISGDDALCFPFLCCGGDGVISVVANAFPSAFSTMVSSAMNGEVQSSRKLHYQLLDIIDQLFVEGNPAGVKAALAILEVCKEDVRLPLVNMSLKGTNRMKELIHKLNQST